MLIEFHGGANDGYKQEFTELPSKYQIREDVYYLWDRAYYCYAPASKARETLEIKAPADAFARLDDLIGVLQTVLGDRAVDIVDIKIISPTIIHVSLDSTLNQILRAFESMQNK